MAIKFGVVVFPGSNCDDDMVHVLGHVMGHDVVKVWHKERNLPELDCVVLPGGFSYGDYLRCGAIARFSPIMQAVKKFAEQGGMVVGICNGFQILCEAGLLPGALVRNRGLHFICRFVSLRVETSDCALTRRVAEGAVLNIPIAHGEGCFFADGRTLEQLERGGQVIFRYATARGEVTEEANPNGSLHSIAGICNARRNVFGLMPHPERACDPLLGSTDGRILFESLLS